MSKRRSQLLEQGFLIVEDVLPQEIVQRLSTATETVVAGMSEAEQARVRAQGSMIPTPAMDEPVFGELIAWPTALQALASLGYDQPTFTDGYIISKPPDSPALFWHYDWFAWGEPFAYEPEPPQVFLMYYLTDTRRENGCLRVIPGSHCRHNPLHDLLTNPHSEELARAIDTDRPEFAGRPDEVDVPVRAGDLVIGDARLLHASHANRTQERRTVITLWYQPRFAALPERVQAQMVAKTHPLPEAWPEEVRSAVARLLPRYDGHAEPCERMLYQPPAAAN